MVNTVHLRTLLEVTRRGSFAAAAANLGYTASAVSQQMSALERETGAKLFERSARSVQPTETALVMSRHAAKVLTDIDALLAATARSQDTSTQEIRLGIFPSERRGRYRRRGEHLLALGGQLHTAVQAFRV